MKLSLRLIENNFQAIIAIELEKLGALQMIRATLPNIAQPVQKAVDVLFGTDKAGTDHGDKLDYRDRLGSRSGISADSMTM